MKFKAFILSCFVSVSALAQSAADVAIVQKYVPSRFFQMKDEVSGAALSLGAGIGYMIRESELDGKGKGRFLVVAYQGATASDSIECELKVIKVVGTAGTVMGATVVSDPDELSGCTDIVFKDLDGDSKPELQVFTSNTRGDVRSPIILKWNGKNFADATPIIASGTHKVSAFRQASVADVKEGSSNLIIDSPFESLDKDGLTRIYVLKNSKVTLLYTYPWWELVVKSTAIPVVLTQTLSLPAGTYTLEIKNRSADLSKAVRAQVQVGANVIIKPIDLCSGPTPKGYKPPNDGDNNEDKNKGCIPRKSTYATVAIKGNEVIKVTAYGATGSYLEVSLLKK